MYFVLNEVNLKEKEEVLFAYSFLRGKCYLENLVEDTILR